MNNENNNTPFTPTAEQNEISTALQTMFAELRTKNGETAQGVVKSARELEDYAKGFAGDDNKPKRLLILSALLACPVDQVLSTKSGTTAVGTALVTAYNTEFDTEEIRKECPSMKKEKEDEQDENEEIGTALAERFGGKGITASKELQKLKVEDLNVLQSASHAGLNTALGRLSTAENPIPDSARNFVSILIGASGGQTGDFVANDGIIAQAANVSTKTLKRGRKALIDWMQATGIGIVNIAYGDGKVGTTYRLNLLESITKIMHGMIHSNNASPDALVAVATLTDNLLTEGREKLQGKLSAEQFENVETMYRAIGEAVDSLPPPSVTESAQAKGSKKSNVAGTFEKIKTKIGELTETADELGLDDLAKRIDNLNSTVNDAVKNVETNPEFVPDFEPINAEIQAIRDLIVEASKGTKEKAEEVKAKGAETGQTPEEIAREYIATLSSAEMIEDERQGQLDYYTDACFMLSAIADNQNPAEKGKVFLHLQDILERAFSQGQHKPQA